MDMNSYATSTPIDVSLVLDMFYEPLYLLENPLISIKFIAPESPEISVEPDNVKMYRYMLFKNNLETIDYKLLICILIPNLEDFQLFEKIYFQIQKLYNLKPYYAVVLASSILYEKCSLIPKLQEYYISLGVNFDRLKRPENVPTSPRIKISPYSNPTSPTNSLPQYGRISPPPLTAKLPPLIPSLPLSRYSPPLTSPSYQPPPQPPLQKIHSSLRASPQNKLPRKLANLSI